MDSLNDEKKKKDAWMRNAYISIMSFPDKTIEHELHVSIKISALNNIIKYFEKIEEYEKCYDLLEIKRKIEEGS